MVGTRKIPRRGKETHFLYNIIIKLLQILVTTLNAIVGGTGIRLTRGCDFVGMPVWCHHKKVDCFLLGAQKIMKCFEKTWCKNSGEINLRAISGPGDGLRARRTLVQVCVENFRASESRREIGPNLTVWFQISGRACDHFLTVLQNFWIWRHISKTAAAVELA